MTTLALPVQPPIWQLGHISVSREVLRGRIGLPQYTETDDYRTFGGEEDYWAFLTTSWQRILLQLRVPYEEAIIVADPPDLDAALIALKAAIGDSVVTRLDRAYTFQ